jgi:Xaa-Pro aminopeptidase
VWAGPWASPEPREQWVAKTRGAGVIASDRPGPGEVALPADLVAARWSLGEDELDRYRSLGRDAAEAMTEVLLAARAEWTGFELAGAGAEALWGRGIHPALTLVGDERRLPLHRHPTAARERLGARAMLVFCARRHGLFANLTRFVYFRPPSGAERRLIDDVNTVEAEALAASKPGATLSGVFAAIAQAYRDRGHPGAERLHHQGGSCGYLSRDLIAAPGVEAKLQPRNAVAWNPSLPGAKVEDTVVAGEAGLEVLTVDAKWPTVMVAGRPRPDVLVR